MKNTKRTKTCFLIALLMTPMVADAVLAPVPITQTNPFLAPGANPYQTANPQQGAAPGGGYVLPPPQIVTAPPSTAQTGTQPTTTTTTTITAPAERKVTAKKPEEAGNEPSPVPEVTNIPDMALPITYRQIRELMIYESNINHGECACPYSPDRIGGQCGSESAYYKPHSGKLYCYYSDISNNDVYFFWLKHGIGITDY